MSIPLRNPRKRFIAIAALTCVVGIPAFGQTESAPPSLAAGQILENVVCVADATQSYALYLPSAYTPSKRWPVIYFFDPVGRGKKPIELYKDIAEKYGFVIAGSNNSRNFGGDSWRSVKAIWLDTHIRFALDERRTYTSGFSGGARMADSMAMGCEQCQIAGVIAHGAGYSDSGTSSGRSRLLYFFAVGEQDFNWPEVMTVRRLREQQGLPYRVETFPGPHQWAPPGVMQDAVEWLMLKSMQAGNLMPDSSFVDRLFQQAKAQADDAEKRGDTSAQLNAYRSLVSDFGDLKEVGGYDQKLETLKKSAELKAALKKEQEQIAEQNRLEDEISRKLIAYANGDNPISLSTDISQALGRLMEEATHAKSETKRTIALRAFAGLWVRGIEMGQRELESHNFKKAEACFQLMSSVSDEPWPHLLLAETHTAMGNKKQALKDIREAVRSGLKDPAVIRDDAGLQDLKSEAEFQKIVLGMSGK